MTKASIWNQIYEQLTFKQYVKIANSYGQIKDGLPNLNYNTYFTRVLRFSTNKSLIKLASKGLSLN